MAERVLSIVFDEDPNGETHIAKKHSEIIIYPDLPNNYEEFKFLIESKLPSTLKNREFSLKTDTLQPLNQVVIEAEGGEFRKSLEKYLTSFVKPSTPEVIIDFGREMLLGQEVKSIVPDPNLREALVTNLSGGIALTELIENSIEAIFKTNNDPDQSDNKRLIKIQLQPTQNDPKELWIDDSGCGVDSRKMSELLKAGKSLNNSKDNTECINGQRGLGGGTMYLCGEFSIYGIGTVATKVLGSTMKIESMTASSDLLTTGFIDWNDFKWEMLIKKEKACRKKQLADSRIRRKKSFFNITVSKLSPKFLDFLEEHEFAKEYFVDELSSYYYLYLKNVNLYGLPPRPPDFKPIQIEAFCRPVIPGHNNEIRRILDKAKEIQAPTWEFSFTVDAKIQNLSQSQSSSVRPNTRHMSRNNVVFDSAVIRCVAFYFPVKNGCETLPKHIDEGQDEQRISLEDRIGGVKVFWVGKYIPNQSVSNETRPNFFEFMRASTNAKGSTPQEVHNRAIVFAFFPGSFQLNDHKTSFSFLDPKFERLRNMKSDEFSIKRDYESKLMEWSDSHDEPVIPVENGESAVEKWEREQLSNHKKKMLRSRDADGKVIEITEIYSYKNYDMKVGDTIIAPGDTIVLRNKGRKILAEFVYLFCTYPPIASAFAGARIFYNEWGKIAEDALGWCSVNNIIFSDTEYQESQPEFYIYKEKPNNPILPETMKPSDEAIDVSFGLKCGGLHNKYVKFNAHIGTHFYEPGSEEPEFTESKASDRTCKSGVTGGIQMTFSRVGKYVIKCTYVSPYPKHLKTRSFTKEVLVEAGPVTGFTAEWSISVDATPNIPVDGSGVIPDIMIQFHDAKDFRVWHLTEDFLDEMEMRVADDEFNLVGGRKLLRDDGKLCLVNWKFPSCKLTKPKMTQLILHHRSLQTQQLPVFLVSGTLGDPEGIQISDECLEQSYSFASAIPTFQISLHDKAGNPLMYSEDICPTLDVKIKGDVEGEEKLQTEKSADGIWQISNQYNGGLRKMFGQTAKLMVEVCLEGGKIFRKQVAVHLKEYCILVFLKQDDAFTDVTGKEIALAANTEASFLIRIVHNEENADNDIDLVLEQNNLSVIREGREHVQRHLVESTAAIFRPDFCLHPDKFYQPMLYEVSFYDLKAQFHITLTPGKPDSVELKSLDGLPQLRYVSGSDGEFFLQLQDAHNNAIKPEEPYVLTKENTEVHSRGLDISSLDLTNLQVTPHKEGWKVSRWKYIVTGHEEETSDLLVKVNFPDVTEVKVGILSILLQSESSQATSVGELHQSKASHRAITRQTRKLSHPIGIPHRLYLSNASFRSKDLSNEDNRLFCKAKFYIGDVSKVQVSEKDWDHCSFISPAELIVINDQRKVHLNFVNGSTCHDLQIPQFSRKGVPYVNDDGSVAPFDLFMNEWTGEYVDFSVQLSCQVQLNGVLKEITSKDFFFKVKATSVGKDEDNILWSHKKRITAHLQEIEKAKFDHSTTETNISTSTQSLISLLHELKEIFQGQPGFIGILSEICNPIQEIPNEPGLAQLVAWKRGPSALSLVIDSHAGPDLLSAMKAMYGVRDAWRRISFIDCSLMSKEDLPVPRFDFNGAQGFQGFIADLIKPRLQVHSYITKCFFAHTLIFDTLENAKAFQRRNLKNTSDIWCLDGGSIENGYVITLPRVIPYFPNVFGFEIHQNGFKDTTRLQDLRVQLDQIWHEFGLFVENLSASNRDDNEVLKEALLFSYTMLEKEPEISMLQFKFSDHDDETTSEGGLQSRGKKRKFNAESEISSMEI